MSELNKRSEDDDLEAPPLLVSALKKLPGESVFVPRSVDEIVSRAARKHLSGGRRLGILRFHWRIWAALTAIVVALGILARLSINRPSARSEPNFASEDFNHDGQVDILDAFALAKQLKSGPSPDARLDINGDGIVDERDVATIAARAVKLEKGGRS